MSTAPKVGVLGPLVVRTDDGAHHPTGREAALLATLATAPGHVMWTAHLVESVWGDDLPSSPRTALHNVVYRLRQFLTEIESDVEVEKRGPGYALAVDPDEVDASRFETAITSSLGSRDDATAARLSEALQLWRGDAFEGLTGRVKRLAAEAQRLEALRSVALEQRIECDLVAGRYRELIPQLVALTSHHPLQENLWAYLMLALYRSDQAAAALRAYRRARTHLAEELGIEPSRSMQRLEEAILARDDDYIQHLAHDGLAMALSVPRSR